MMKQTQIEPGLLSLFRLTTALWLLLPISELLGAVLGWNPSSTPWAPLGALNEVFLLLYLYSEWLRHRLGQRYLPIGLVIFSIGAMMVQWVDIAWHIERGISLDLFLADRVSLLFHLFIPAIVVTVQYGFRTTIGFVLSTSALQLSMALVLVPFDKSALEIVWYDAVWRVTFHLIVSFLVAHLVFGQKKDRKSLTEKNIELTRYATTVEQLAVSHERNRMAREFHDTLAHTLSAVSVQLEALSAQLEDAPPDALKTLATSQQLTRSGLQETRRALQALRASPLEDLGLVRALQQLGEDIAARSGLQINCAIFPDIDGLPLEVEQSIYRIAEEALNNIVRHANAQRVSLILTNDAANLNLEIQDDGVGFDTALISQSGRYGLMGMQERAILCGGKLDIESTRGQSTRINLLIER